MDLFYAALPLASIMCPSSLLPRQIRLGRHLRDPGFRILGRERRAFGRLTMPIQSGGR